MDDGSVKKPTECIHLCQSVEGANTWLFMYVSPSKCFCKDASKGNKVKIADGNKWIGGKIPTTDTGGL